MTQAIQIESRVANLSKKKVPLRSLHTARPESAGAYSDYQESGVEWIGKIPSHWQLPPLYTRYEVVLGKMLDSAKQSGAHATPYLRNVDVQWDFINPIDLPQMDVAPAEWQRYSVEPGDLLVCEGGEVGRSAIWNGELPECAFQKALHRLRPLSIDENVRFLFYSMRFAADQNAFVVNSNLSTIPHLTGEQLRRYRLPTPPLTEQKLIVRFLDRETAKIDALISEQQRLMELLKEKRQAVISHAVTKGLNLDAPMKDSGVEWLGNADSMDDLSARAGKHRSVRRSVRIRNQV